MRLGAFAAEMAVLDILLGVIPGAAAGRHRDGDEEAGDDRSHQQAAKGLRPEQQADDERHQHRQQRRQDHFLDRRLGQHVDGARVIRLGVAIHDAGDLAELAAHLDNDSTGCAPDRFHRHRAEQVGDHAANEEADDDHVIGQIKAQNLPESRFQRVRIVGEEDERRETGRADGIAFRHRLGRVTDRVERVSNVAHILRQPGHFSDTAGVVGDRPVSIKRDDDAGHRQHRGGGDGDAIEPGERVGQKNRSADANHRQRRRLHRNAETGDDVGAVAGRRRFSH